MTWGSKEEKCSLWKASKGKSMIVYKYIHYTNVTLHYLTTLHYIEDLFSDDVDVMSTAMKHYNYYASSLWCKSLHSVISMALFCLNWGLCCNVVCNLIKFRFRRCLVSLEAFKRLQYFINTNYYYLIISLHLANSGYYESFNSISDNVAVVMARILI